MTLSAEDSLEILQLVARVDACATVRDADGYAALFTEDAVMDGAMGRAEGRAALSKTVAAVWASEPAGTLHLTLNSVIDDTRAEPSVESLMLMVTTGSSPAVLGSARVIQAVRKTPAGWRVAARTISKQPSLG
jgi:ketosteroid isomerase-like protein